MEYEFETEEEYEAYCAELDMEQEMAAYMEYLYNEENEYTHDNNLYFICKNGMLQGERL